MHPDDQPPAPPARRKPRFPSLLLSLAVGSLASLSVAVSGAQSWSSQWWSIILSTVMLFFFVRLFFAFVIRWALARFELSVIETERDNDSSI